jgi:hypothetical protein
MSTLEPDGWPAVSDGAVHLRQVQSSDYRRIHESESIGGAAWRWRQRGRITAPDEFVRGLWAGVIAQFIVVGRSGEDKGLVLAYDPDTTNGICRLGVFKFDLEDRSPDFLIGTKLFVDYVFYWWPFRKLYAESTTPSFKQFSAGVDLGLFDLEAELKEYAYRGGQYDSLFILSISRDRWDVFIRANERLFASAPDSD